MRSRPYAVYALMIVAHLSLFAGAAALGRRLQRPLHRDFSIGDLMALGFATFRLSRLITYERVTTVLRLPFADPNSGPTHPEGTRGMPRGQGLQLALGQLFTWSSCMGVWIGALLSYATALAPGASRLFILGLAAAGVGQLADEVFGLLHQIRARVLAAAGPVQREAPEGAACPICGEAISHEGGECPGCGAPMAVGSEVGLRSLSR